MTMFQNTLNTTLTAAQAKSIESAQTIATLAVQSAEAIAEINYDAAKEVVSAAQAQSAKLIQLKDPKAALEMFDAESAKEAAAQVVVYQNKVLRKNSKEVASLIDSAIDDSKADLKKFVKEAAAQAPAGSEAYVSAFNTVFDAALKSFDQARATSHDAYVNFEKTVDAALSSFQGQVAPATKSRKQIAA
jgi:hypothetical protein